MPKLTNLSVALTGNAGSLVRAAGLGLRSIRRLTRGVSVARAGLAGLVGGLGAGLTAGGVISVGRAALGSLDKVSKLSEKLGISADEVERLRLQADLSGTSIDTVAQAFLRVQRLRGDALGGNKESVKAFEAIGVSIEELQRLKGPQQLFDRVVGSLSAIRDPSERAARANKILQESWQQLTPFILNFTKTGAQADSVLGSLGAGLGETADHAAETQDAISALSATLTGMRDRVVGVLSKDITAMVEKLREFALGWFHAQGGAEGLAKSIADFVGPALVLARKIVDDASVGLKALGAIATFVIDSLKSAARVGATVAAIAVPIAQGEFSVAANAAAAGFGASPDTIARLNTRVREPLGEDATQEEILAEQRRQTEILRDFRSSQFGAASVFN